MTYVTGIERRGLARGLEAGRVEGKRITLRRLVQHRFGQPPEALDQRIADADEATLDQMLDRVIDASSVEAL